LIPGITFQTLYFCLQLCIYPV